MPRTALRDGDDGVLIVGFGKMAQRALVAAGFLANEGVNATVIDPRLVRPLDPALVERAVAGACSS